MKIVLYASLLVLSLSAAAQSAPMHEGDVDVGSGVNIHYVDGGVRDAKTTILFVPGWSMSTAVWRDQMALFAPTARVVAIDPRSQGRSTITPQSNTPEQRAQDLSKVIKSLALKNVVLVGWSQGVQDVAAYAAAFEGADIAGYVLVDSSLGAGVAPLMTRPEELKQRLERFATYQQYPRQYLQGMMNAIIQSPEARKRIPEYVQISSSLPPDLGIVMLMADLIIVDRRPALAKFNRPTLLIAAAKSPELDAQREMSRQIKGAQIETIDDAGHAVFLDQPERFRSLLADFVRRLGST